MRNVPDELAARIESGAATLCHVWLLRRADGRAMGFTDHDRDLEVEGAACRAASGWTGGAGDGEVGLAAGALSASGGLDDAAITEEDIAAGRYDAAEVEAVARGLDAAGPEGAAVEGEAGADTEGERAVRRRSGRADGGAGAGGRADLWPGLRCGDWAMDGAGWMRRWWPGATATSGGRPVVGVFGNGVNFQGFPDIPGEDFLTARPVAGRNDGRSRRR
jgi:hypothetical protein